ncbi:MAG: histidine phosphatase family protein [Pseudomonadota bacterium]
MYQLLLLRHGKSDWETNHDDFHRPINDRGKRSAQRIGVWMAQQRFILDRVISSPAERAKTTAEKMLKAKGDGAQNILFDERIYLADVDDLFDVLKEVPDSIKTLLLVGHNPGMEELLLSLVAKPIKYPDNGNLFPTATLADLSLTLPWKEIKAGSATLEQLIYPKKLPKKFPYPLPFGAEKRVRPAYYYQQSAVIPYRYINGKLQILLISSSKNKHMVIPKGIKEPGLTPQDSAAKEALEEAGIEGQVESTIIGSYDYQKWKASTHVDIYPMLVSRELDESSWQESHRGRIWMTIEEAINKIYQPELKAIFEQFQQYIKR